VLLRPPGDLTVSVRVVPLSMYTRELELPLTVTQQKIIDIPTGYFGFRDHIEQICSVRFENLLKVMRENPYCGFLECLFDHKHAPEECICGCMEEGAPGPTHVPCNCGCNNPACSDIETRSGEIEEIRDQISETVVPNFDPEGRTVLTMELFVAFLQKKFREDASSFEPSDSFLENGSERRPMDGMPEYLVIKIVKFLKLMAFLDNMK